MKTVSDSVGHVTIFDSLQDQHISKTFIKVIENIYSNDTEIISPHKDTSKIKIEKGVRQKI